MTNIYEQLCKKIGVEPKSNDLCNFKGKCGNKDDVNEYSCNVCPNHLRVPVCPKPTDSLVLGLEELLYDFITPTEEDFKINEIQTWTDLDVDTGDRIYYLNLTHHRKLRVKHKGSGDFYTWIEVEAATKSDCIFKAIITLLDEGILTVEDVKTVFKECE